MRRLGSKDYYDAFALSEIVFLLLAVASRLVDKNFQLPAVLFMAVGVLFAVVAYEKDHPGAWTGKMGE